MTAQKNITELDNKKPVRDNLIDLDKVIADKSSLLKKILPGFVTAYLKRLIHQDWLNYLLTEYGEYTGVEFIDHVLTDMNTKLDLRHLENIPKSGKCIIAANHPLGGLDGMALMLGVSRVRKDIVFPVNDILLNIKNLQELFIPINKHGSNTENIQIINDTFASDKLICYFPFGLVSRKRNGKVSDLEWKTTFITKAKRFRRDIIPTHISGQNSNFFYNLANFRKRFRIKINLEMLLLVDELDKQQGNTLVFSFGEKVPYSFFDNRYTKTEWAELMRKYVYKLGDGFETSFVDWVESNP
jgi:putative hemolysin